MAREGAGEASALSPDGVSIPMALNAIALCFVSDVSAHDGGLNAEGCHHDRNRGGYHCHRGGGALSRSDATSINRLATSRIHLCACRGIRACLRIVLLRVQRVLRR